MECFRLLLEHTAWIEHQFLSGIRNSRKAGSLWGMMRGVGRVRKSVHQSWLVKVLGLGLLCWGFKGVQDEIPTMHQSTTASLSQTIWRRWALQPEEITSKGARVSYAPLICMYLFVFCMYFVWILCAFVSIFMHLYVFFLNIFCICFVCILRVFFMCFVYICKCFYVFHLYLLYLSATDRLGHKYNF